MRALIEGVLDVAGASPRRYFFEVLHRHATEPVEVDRLEHFSNAEGRDDLHRYNQSEGEGLCHELCVSSQQPARALNDCKTSSLSGPLCPMRSTTGQLPSLITGWLQDAQPWRCSRTSPQLACPCSGCFRLCPT